MCCHIKTSQFPSQSIDWLLHDGKYSNSFMIIIMVSNVSNPSSNKIQKIAHLKLLVTLNNSTDDFIL